MTTANQLSDQEQAPQSSLRRLIWVAPLAMLAATVANIALYALAGAIAPEVTAWPGAGPGQIIGSTIGYLFFGAIVLAVVSRLSSNPALHYLIVATIGLLLSMALPISAGLGSGQQGTDPAGTATVITLSLMHVVSYAISVPLYIRLVLD